MFDKLQNLSLEKLAIDNITFRLGIESKRSRPAPDVNEIPLYKWKSIIDLYKKLFTSLPLFRPKHILELGVWEGGSIVFWQKLFNPTKIVGVDRINLIRPEIFQNYFQSDSNSNQTAKFFEADQMDDQRLSEIVASEFNNTIDLIIDDCSHMYFPTKTSFEILFPYLIPGGWYIVEDWAWGHALDYSITYDHPFAEEEPLSKFVFDIIEMYGTSATLISQLEINRYFIAIQKGANGDAKFSIDNNIYRHIPFSRRKLSIAARIKRYILNAFNKL